MALILKQGTAVDVLIGPFLDLTDGATSEEAESPTVLLSKNGQALAAKNDVTGPTHDNGGYYNCELDATDTDTVGTLVLVVEKSANALPVRHEFQVVEENVYDAWFGASAAAGTDLASILTDTGTTLDGKLDTIDTNVDAILVDTGDTIPSLITVVDVVVDAILVDTAEIGAAGAGLTEAGGTGDQLTALATQASVDTIDSNVDAILVDTGDTIPSLITVVDAVVDAILVDTAEIGAAGAGLTDLATAAALATVDTVVDGIKAKTDSLNFTVAGEVNANVQSINDVEIVGDGSATPFNV